MRFQTPKKPLLAALLAFALSVSCAPAHAGVFDVKPEKERTLGQDAARSIEAQTRVMTGPVADWVERVGQKLARASDKEFAYSFRVIDNPEINAFALPGGHIYVFSGLSKIARSEDELAAVLAHEITHAEQHHYARQSKKANTRGTLLAIVSIFAGLPSIAQNVLGIVDFSMTQRYSRVHETEADALGMERMQRAGYDPKGMVTLLQGLARKSDEQKRVDKWFASHPDGDARVRRASEQLQKMQSATPVVKASTDVKTDAGR